MIIFLDFFQHYSQTRTILADFKKVKKCWTLTLTLSGLAEYVKHECSCSTNGCIQWCLLALVFEFAGVASCHAHMFWQVDVLKYSKKLNENKMWGRIGLSHKKIGKWCIRKAITRNNFIWETNILERVQKYLTRIPNGSPVIQFRGSTHRLKFVYSARDLDVRFCSVTSRIFCLNINLI